MKTLLAVLTLSIVLPLLSGCQLATKNTPEESSTDRYYEHRHEGRYYVFGNHETAEAFAQAGSHPPFTLTLVGEGPDGETVVVEADKNDKSFEETLLAEFRRRHP